VLTATIESLEVAAGSFSVLLVGTSPSRRCGRASTLLLVKEKVENTCLAHAVICIASVSKRRLIPLQRVTPRACVKLMLIKVPMSSWTAGAHALTCFGQALQRTCRRVTARQCRATMSADTSGMLHASRQKGGGGTGAVFFWSRPAFCPLILWAGRARRLRSYDRRNAQSSRPPSRPPSSCGGCVMIKVRAVCKVRMPCLSACGSELGKRIFRAFCDGPLDLGGALPGGIRAYVWLGRSVACWEARWPPVLAHARRHSRRKLGFCIACVGPRPTSPGMDFIG
jgi:hypothetical protein